MMNGVDKLFFAQSFAVIGASDKPGFGGGSSKGIAMSADPVRVYYVNPSRDELFGRRCYHSLGELPEVVDCVVLSTAAKRVPPYLEKAGAAGVKAAVVYGSGFSEEGSAEGKALEEQCRQICEKYGMVMCGPNCMGFVNNVNFISGYGSPPVFPAEPIGKGVGVVAQSGYINSFFVRNYPNLVAYAASCGNGAIASLEDFLLFYAQDEHVNCIAAYMEGIKHADRLAEALAIAARRHKPVIILKSGRSKMGATAAASHTGNLAGDFAAFESTFRRFGAIITDSLEEFSVTVKMFAMLADQMPKSAGIGAINFSGGENTLCADYCEKYGLSVPKLQPETLATIQALIPPYSTASNPLDPTTTMFTQAEKVSQLFRALSEDPNVGIITLGNDVGDPSEPKDITCAKVLPELKAEGVLVPTFIIPSFEKPRSKEVRAAFEGAGIPVLSTGETAYRQLRHLCNFLNYDPEEHTLEIAPPVGADTSRPAVMLSETDSKAILSGIGIRVPAQAEVSVREDLAAGLQNIPYPVVMKVNSPDISHKTEAGGVKLNIGSLAEAEAAYDAILTSCRAYAPDARIDGVLIQEMAPAGCEMIAGIKSDPQLGPILLVGMGGIFAEVFRDVAMCPCPVAKHEALTMLESLKSAKLLHGYRGSAPLDVDALADALVKISNYAAENSSRITEMDVNPLVVYEQGKGVIALDGLIGLRDPD